MVKSFEKSSGTRGGGGGGVARASSSANDDMPDNNAGQSTRFTRGDTAAALPRPTLLASVEFPTGSPAWPRSQTSPHPSSNRSRSPRRRAASMASRKTTTWPKSSRCIARNASSISEATGTPPNTETNATGTRQSMSSVLMASRRLGWAPWSSEVCVALDNRRPNQDCCAWNRSAAAAKCRVTFSASTSSPKPQLAGAAKQRAKRTPA
mmetsp:Transcript_58480/g.163898  ORF Transcript_58480/g.163898 Transcript_58480/m.163898 type:complete len:208 (-) Transcript_58480:162-785(-)